MKQFILILVVFILGLVSAKYFFQLDTEPIDDTSNPSIINNKANDSEEVSTDSNDSQFIDESETESSQPKIDKHSKTKTDSLNKKNSEFVTDDKIKEIENKLKNLDQQIDDDLESLSQENKKEVEALKAEINKKPEGLQPGDDEFSKKEYEQ